MYNHVPKQNKERRHPQIKCLIIPAAALVHPPFDLCSVIEAFVDFYAPINALPTPCDWLWRENVILITNIKRSNARLSNGDIDRCINVTLLLMEKANGKLCLYLLRRVSELNNNSSSDSKIELALQSPVSETYLDPLTFIAGERVHIIFALTDMKLSSMILCLTYRLGLVSPNQQWLFIGRASIDFRAISFAQSTTVLMKR